MIKIKTLSRSSSVSPLRLPPSIQTYSQSKEASETEHTTLKKPRPKTAMKDVFNIPSAHSASNKGREALKEDYSSVHNCSCSQAIDETVKKTGKKRNVSETAQEKMLREEHRYTNQTEDTPCLAHPVSPLNHNSYEDFKRRAYVEWITIDSHHRNITEHDTIC